MAKSRVQKKKEEMMWLKTGPKCSNCIHFTSEIITKKNDYFSWDKERKKRCSRGDFATLKCSWCADHEFK